MIVSFNDFRFSSVCDNESRKIMLVGAKTDVGHCGMATDEAQLTRFESSFTFILAFWEFWATFKTVQTSVVCT